VPCSPSALPICFHRRTSRSFSMRPSLRRSPPTWWVSSSLRHSSPPPHFSRRGWSCCRRDSDPGFLTSRIRHPQAETIESRHNRTRWPSCRMTRLLHRCFQARHHSSGWTPASFPIPLADRVSRGELHRRTGPPLRRRRLLRHSRLQRSHRNRPLRHHLRLQRCPRGDRYDLH
jgi:hypothetical protein